MRSSRRYQKQTRDELRKQTRLTRGEDPFRVEHPHRATLGDGIDDLEQFSKWIGKKSKEASAKRAERKAQKAEKALIDTTGRYKVRLECDHIVALTGTPRSFRVATVRCPHCGPWCDPRRVQAVVKPLTS